MTTDRQLSPEELAYVKAVLAQLPALDPDTEAEVSCSILQRRQAGFTVDEAARYCRNFEEVNPDLDEDTALRRMKEIQEKVTLRTTEGKIVLEQTPTRKVVAYMHDKNTVIIDTTTHTSKGKETSRNVIKKHWVEQIFRSLIEPSYDSGIRY